MVRDKTRFTLSYVVARRLSVADFTFAVPVVVIEFVVAVPLVVAVEFVDAIEFVVDFPGIPPTPNPNLCVNEPRLCK